MSDERDETDIAGRKDARRNGRDVIAPRDLPVTTGREERMQEFDKLDVADGIRELLRQNLCRPPDDVTFSDEKETLLADVLGGISVALARSFRILDEDVRNPSTVQRERAIEPFRLVL